MVIVDKETIKDREEWKGITQIAKSPISRTKVEDKEKDM